MSTSSSISNDIQAKVINATSKVVPMHLQIKALKNLMKVKRKTIGTSRPQVHFVETDLPDVNDVAIEDIDTSNPFLYRQSKSNSYFKRLRDEAPVHYQKDSAFGPFWSVTRYEDIVFVDRSHDFFPPNRKSSWVILRKACRSKCSSLWILPSTTYSGGQSRVLLRPRT